MTSHSLLTCAASNKRLHRHGAAPPPWSGSAVLISPWSGSHCSLDRNIPSRPHRSGSRRDLDLTGLHPSMVRIQKAIQTRPREAAECSTPEQSHPIVSLTRNVYELDVNLSGAVHHPGRFPSLPLPPPYLPGILSPLPLRLLEQRPTHLSTVCDV